MPNYDGSITGFVCGDDLTITRTIGNIPSGQTLTSATITIKDIERAVTPLVQYTVTSVSSANGVITDTGADGTGAVTFQLSNTDTALLTPNENCFYWIDVVTSASKIYTPEKGVIRGEVNNS